MRIRQLHVHYGHIRTIATFILIVTRSLALGLGTPFLDQATRSCLFERRADNGSAIESSQPAEGGQRCCCNSSAAACANDLLRDLCMRDWCAACANALLQDLRHEICACANALLARTRPGSTAYETLYFVWGIILRSEDNCLVCRTWQNEATCMGHRRLRYYCHGVCRQFVNCSAVERL